jgi:hypothetical protein
MPGTIGDARITQLHAAENELQPLSPRGGVGAVSFSRSVHWEAPRMISQFGDVLDDLSAL